MSIFIYINVNMDIYMNTHMSMNGATRLLETDNFSLSITKIFLDRLSMIWRVSNIFPTIVIFDLKPFEHILG